MQHETLAHTEDDVNEIADLWKNEAAESIQRQGVDNSPGVGGGGNGGSEGQATSSLECIFFVTVHISFAFTFSFPSYYPFWRNWVDNVEEGLLQLRQGTM